MGLFHVFSNRQIELLFPDQPNEIIVGTKTRQPFSVTEVSRHGSYVQSSCPFPVGINI
jgi:hypothetical protein